MADIKWTFFADTNAAERAIQALEQKYTNLEASIKRTAKSSKSGADTAAAGLKSMSASAVSAVAAYTSLSSVISGTIAEAQKLVAQAERAGEKFDDVFRKFRVQGNLTELQGESAKKNIIKTAQVAATSAEQAGNSATQLVSSGFSAEQAQGPALMPFLKTLAASNQVGANVDSRSLAHAMASYMNSQGMELNGANMEKVGVGMQRLFKSQDIQLPDMEHLAKVGSVMRGKLTTEEQFSAMASLKNSGLGGAEASVALRNAVMSMTAMKGDKNKMKALKEMGLSPEDIDLQGETFTEALATMGKAFAKVDPLKADSLKKQFFEKEGVASIGTLVNDAGKIGEMNKLQGDVAGFNQDVAISTSGRNAAGRRLALSNEAAAAEQDPQGDNWRSALEKYDRSKGKWQLTMAADLAVYDTLRAVGVSPEKAMFTAAGENDWKNVEALLKEANQAAMEQKQLLSEIAGNTKEQAAPKFNRNANTDNPRGE